MNVALWILDGLMVSSLIGLAWMSLAATDHFKAIVLFIAFGMLMALAWARLDAPDVALAEAAIGAGLTGALLLSTLARISAPVAIVPPVADGDVEETQ